MARKPELKQRFNTMVTLEYEDYQAFVKMIGEGNFSNEIRAYVKDRINLQKKEQARDLDPLNLLKNPEACNDVKNTRQTSLFEIFAIRDQRDEIVKFVQTIPDTQKLNQLEQNARCMLGVAKTRREKIMVRVTE